MNLPASPKPAAKLPLPERIWQALALVFGNPLKWSRVDKSIAISATSVPVALGYYLEIHGLVEHPEIAPYANHAFLTAAEPYLLAFIVYWTVLLGVSLYLRRRDPDNRVIQHATIHTYLLANAAATYLFGPVTNPYGIVLLGACLITIILFDIVPAFLGIASVFTFFLVTGVAESVGWLPYAPFFTAIPLVDGRLPAWFSRQMTLIAVLNPLELLIVFSYIQHQLHRHAAELESASKTDFLTGLPNRRHLIEALGAELERSQRYGAPLAIMMIDIDHFKNINDRHGHLAGDQVIRIVGQIIKDSMRRPDTVARYGGEEFMLLLPSTEREGAMVVAERLLHRVASTPVHVGTAALTCTVSIGLICFPETPYKSLDEVLSLADKRMYEAKTAGRNRVA
jgi:diguanylate cyclase (GGDEF)-like protein